MRGKHGKQAKGKHAGRWNQGKMFSTEGYIKIRVGKAHPLSDPNGYCYEHKLVATAAYGTDFIKGKIIHHLNHDKTDNRLENLELLTRADHNRLHNKEKAKNAKGQFISKNVMLNF